jgi:hypothetical protein
MSSDPIENWVHEQAEMAVEHMGAEWAKGVLRKHFMESIKDVVGVLSRFNDTAIVRNKEIDKTIEEYNKIIEKLE